MGRKEEALSLYKSGFNCSQSVLAVFCEELGYDKDTALRIATGFGGGFRKGEVCGAVSGAVMVLGLKYGHHIEGDTVTKGNAYAVTQRFIEKFQERPWDKHMQRTPWL